MRPQPRLLVFNDPHPMRIDGALAAEIGLEESVVLLQLEYLITISTVPEHEGKRWTYQSLQGLHDQHFPWWSVATISRIVKSLENKQLITVANFNKKGYDRTRWFSLNPEGINKLHSIAIYQNAKSILQNEKSILQSGDMQPNKLQNGFCNFESPIPETPTEISTEEEEYAQASDDPFEALINSPSPFERTDQQPIADSPPSEAPHVAPAAPSGYSPLATALAEVCGVSLERGSAPQKRALRAAVEELRQQNATPEQVQHFARYWKAKGKTRLPRPEFVVADWRDAMYSFRPARPVASPREETPEEQEARFARLAREYAALNEHIRNTPSSYRVANSGD